MLPTENGEKSKPIVGEINGATFSFPTSPVLRVTFIHIIDTLSSGRNIGLKIILHWCKKTNLKNEQKWNIFLSFLFKWNLIQNNWFQTNHNKSYEISKYLHFQIPSPVQTGLFLLMLNFTVVHKVAESVMKDSELGISFYTSNTGST